MASKEDSSKDAGSKDPSSKETAPKNGADLGAKLAAVQRLRRIAVIVGLVLLVASLMNPTTTMIYARSALWAVCGCMALVEVSLFRRARDAGAAIDPNTREPTYIRVFLYFAVAVLGLWRR